MSRNKGDIVHIEYLARKAKAILGKVCRLGEKKLGENRENEAVRGTGQKYHGL